MTEAATSLEVLLREALVPVDPPADLGRRLESTLTSLTEIAAGELESWELRAMRDPRNWVRPAAALVVGGTAGAALVVIRARQRSRQRAKAKGLARVTGVREAAVQVVRDASDEAGKLLHRGR